MIKGRVRVINDLGLHARVAAQVVKTAGRFESTIVLVREDKSAFADAKSILSLLTLAASRGVELALEVEGSDEQEAFEAITSLFVEGFGELN